MTYALVVAGWADLRGVSAEAVEERFGVSGKRRTIAAAASPVRN
jgi:hypothetical protein